MQFLSGVPARDYVFQHTPYEEQVREAAALLKSADAVIIGAGAGLSTAASPKNRPVQARNHIQKETKTEP